jgi:hypothetical protein
MLISHEVPLTLLEKSRNFNDYDYALVHLFDEIPEYKQFFIDSIKKYNRRVILDNSLFELGTIFNSNKFAKSIIETTPTEFIIPDALEDINSTIKSCDNWLADYDDIPGIKIGVVQGNNRDELIECYKYMSDRVDKISVPYYNSAYIREYDSVNNPSISSYHKLMIGRINFINYLVDYNIINKNKPHHLLGCSLPQEFKSYKKCNFIESIDTSNPVVHGLLGIPYQEYGLNSKESIKLIELMHSPIENEDIVLSNIDKFRQFCN